VKKRIPYGIGDFEKIRKENFYYVDKTQIIKDLEKHQYPFFIRPRRFGKSLLISTLEHYYDIEKKDAFDELFKGLWIHDNPTEERNSYLVLRLDFSGIETSQGKQALYDSFTDNVKEYILPFLRKYKTQLQVEKEKEIQQENNPAQLMKSFISTLKQSNHKAILLIDEYDNFANDLIGANEDNLYYDILSKTGFIRTFYEAVKSGAQEGAIARIFLTGVSPIMLDDLTSGYNIASNITLDYEYNEALGFTQTEVEQLLDYYWRPDAFESNTKSKILEEIKTYYNGYKFNKNAEQRLYNPDMVLYYMKYLARGTFPDERIDMNVRTDYGKLQRLLKENRKAGTQGEITTFEKINEKEEIITKIKQMFPLEQITGTDEIISLMYYMGMLTIKEPYQAMVKLKIPNLVIKELYWEYIYTKINDALGGEIEFGDIAKALSDMSKTGNPRKFVEFTYDKVKKYMSNRDLIGIAEKHIKLIFLSFLSVNNIYIPYSELEMGGGYSDLVLYPDTRYGVKNSQIWELKYIKEKEDPKEKIKDAIEQIKKYEQDAKFQRLTAGTDIYKYIILAYKDKIELLEQNQ